MDTHRTAGLRLSRGRWRNPLSFLPQGRNLAPEDWGRRHRAILVILVFYIVGLAIFGFYRGFSLTHLALDSGGVAVLTLWAAQPYGGRKVRSTLASLALLTAAAIGVHLSGGVIEAHFQFFVVITLLMLYQDWFPFLVAIAYVVAEHGAGGALIPTSVYNHPAAQKDPWLWAGIHGAFVLAASAANLAHWRLSEDDHLRTQRTELSYQRLFAANPQPMWVYDVNTLAFLDVNDAAIERYGYSREEFLAMTIRDIRPAEDVPAVEASVLEGDEDIQGSGPWRHLTKTGELLLVRVSSHRIQFGATEARHVIAQDVTENESLVNQLRHQAFHDVMTGLPNRALLVDRLAVLLQQSQRSGRTVATLFCDLDRFKPINDSLGHDIGDMLLNLVAERFGGVLRAQDTLARLGGDEFVIVCEVENEAAAVSLAGRLREALNFPFDLAGHQVRVTTSIGIALADNPTSKPDDLIRNADIAMYRAKTRGRAGFEMFDTAMHGRAVQRLAIEQELRPALGRDEFRLHYQPVVSSGSRGLVAFEALLRWQHPVRGLVPPGDFIAVAEDSGFILTLGAWVLGEACRQMAEWVATNGTAVKVSVNLSARQLADPGLVDYIDATLEATGLAPSCLVLEITESVLMANIDSSFETLGAIKKLGVGVSVDDFGTGYSSLAYLAQVPLDYLKLDRSFVASLETDTRSRVLASTVINLARNLGVSSVGEGVETEGQLEILRELGCDLIQGYLTGRPESAIEAEVQWVSPAQPARALASG